jgi:O-antigen/teichoic acid export membrane protein
MIGGVVMSGLSRAAVMVTGAAATIVVAHVLGPSGLGPYAAAQTLIAVLMVVTTLGVEHGIVYFVSSGRWSPAEAFRGSQRLALVGGVLGAGAGVLARLLVPEAFHGLSLAVTVVAAAALPFALSWFYGSYVALATDHYEAYVLPSAIQSTMALGLVAGLGAVDGVAGCVIGFTLAHVLTAGVRFGPARRSAGSRRVTSDEKAATLGHAVRFGIKGYAANALQAINYRLDLFILNATAASAAVGHYAVAVSITSVMWLLPQSLSDVLYPRIASISSGPGEERAEILRLAEAKGLRHSVLASIIVGIALALALLVLVAPIYGGGFGQSTDLGLILLPGVALLGMANPLSATIVGRGRPDLMLVAAIVVTPLTLILYVLLIPALRAPGAALASSLSYAAMFCLTAIFYRRVSGSNPLRVMMPTRSELADYRALAGRVRLRGLRRWRP